MASKMGLLSFDPPELVFQDVLLNQAYIQEVVVTNHLAIAVTISTRPGSSERYSVAPPSLTLAAGASASLAVTLKVLKFADRRKAETTGQRDIFHVKSSFSEHKFYSTFFLAPLAPPPYPPSEYGGLLSPPHERRPRSLTPPWGGTQTNRHRREGLQVPHSDAPLEERRTGFEKARHPSPGGPSRSLANEGRGDEIPRALPATGVHRLGPVARSGRTSSPAHEHGLTGPHNERHSFGGLDSPPSSCSPPRTRAPTSIPSSPRQRGMLELNEVAPPQYREENGAELLNSRSGAEALLREKEEIIAALKSQLEVRTARVLAPRGGPGDPPPVEELLERVGEAEGANDELRARLREVTAELAGVKEERTTLLQLQEMLEAATPDAVTLAEAARVRERAHAASREEKMMALLAAKDAAQASLEHDMEAAGSALEGMRNSLEGMGAQLEASEARVVELLEGRQGVRESARAQAQELQRALEEAREARDAAEKRAHVAENDKAALQAQLEEQEARLDDLSQSNEALTAQLQAARQAEQQAHRATTRISEHEAAAGAAEPASWRRALEEAEAALSAKDDLVQQLEEMLSQQMERIQTLTAQLHAAPRPTLATPANTFPETPHTAPPQSDATDLPPEPRSARPSGPQIAPGGQEEPPTFPRGRTSYGTLMSRGVTLTRRSPQRAAVRGPPELEETGTRTRGGKSLRKGDAAEGLVARAEAAERGARELEAKVEQLERLQKEQQGRTEAARRTNGDEALAKNALLQVEVDRLRIQVTDLERELAAATAGTTQRERKWLDHKEAAARRALAAAAAHAAEVGSATRRAAEAERKAAVAGMEVRQLREELQAARAETERARAAAESGKAAAEKRVAAKEEAVRKLQEEAMALRRAAEQAASVADEKGLQVTVLMETVETLHSGSDGEREQCLVTLTAQLAAAKAIQAALERRATLLQDEARQEGQAGAAATAELERARARLKQREQRLAQSAGAHEVLRREVGALRADLRDREAQSAGLAREVDQLKEALKEKTEEAESRGAAMEQQGKRLLGQLQRERTEAAAEVQSLREELAAASYPQATEEGYLPPSIAARLQEALDKTGGADWQAVVISRLTSLVMDSERGLSRAQAEGRMKGGEAARLREHVAALESALERKISEWEVSEGRLAAAQARREQRKTDDAGWAEARVELLTGRVESLGGQLERAEKELVAVRVELAGAVQEGARFKEQAERLGRRVMVAEADLAAGKEAERGQGGESQESGKRDEEIKAWFEEQVLRALLRADPQEKLLAITRELAALKLANGQLQDSLARACQKQDAAVTHASALHRVIDQLESNLERAAPPETDESIEGDPPVTSAAELSARLAVKTQELFALQDEGLAQRQRIARLEADLTEAQAQRAESVGAVGRQREQLEAGAQARAEEAAAAHREELRKVRQELEAGARAHRQERAALHQEKVRVLEEAQSEHAAAMAAVQAQLADAVRQQQALQGVQNTARRIPQLEQELEQCRTENEHLISKVAALTAQLAALQDERELQAGVVSDLERILARIEHAGASPVRGGSSKTAVAGGSLAAVSKQLVQAKLAEADAQRKLRVSARAELELRQLLAEREKRIDQLKQGRVTLSPRPGPPRAEQWSEAEDGTGEESGEQWAARRQQVVELRIEVAKKEAAIAGLQGALADATANGRRQDADLQEIFGQRDELERQLEAARQAERQLRRRAQYLEEDHVLTAAAISSAVVADGAGTLNRPPPQGPLTVAVQKLVQRLRDKDLALRKMRQRKSGGMTSASEAETVLTPASDEPGLSLVDSQSLVIQQLSARIATLLEEQTRLRAEGVTVPAPQPALPANDSAPPAAGTPAPPLSPPEEAPLPRVASWSDRLSTPKHPKPSVFKNAQKAAPSQATASVKGGMAKCHEDGPRSPKPRPLSPAIRRQQNQERAPEGDSRAVADANRPQPTIQTGQSQVNGTDGSLIEKQESIMVKRHVACGDRQPFADPRRSTGELSGTEPVLENPGRNATEAPEGEHFFEAFHQTGRTVSGERQFSERPQQRAGDLPAGKSNLSLGAGKVPEAAAVSALCDLLLQHMEALEASKLEVRAAAAGAAALGEARAAEHEEERNKTGRNASGRKESGRKENGRNESGRNEGARKDKGATERAEKGSGRVGNNEGRPNGGLDSSGLNRRVKREVTEEPVLSILPEKLEATAGAMAKELTAMRAALAVLAQGLGDLHAPRGHQPGTVSVGTAVQTERVSQTDFAVQTVGSVREEDETRGRLVVNSGATVEYHASTNNETPVQIGAPVRSKTRAQTDASAQTEAFSKSDRTAQTEATVARTATAQTDVTIDGTVVRTGIALDRTVDQAEKVLDGSLGGLVRRSSGVLQDQCDAIFQTDLPVPLPALTGPTDALRSVAVSNRPELQSAGVTETAPLLRIADAINTTERFEAWGKIDPVGSDQSLGESEAVRVDTNPEESGAVQPVVPTTVLRAASERTSGHVAEGGQARPHGNGVVYPRAEQEKNIAAGAVQFHSALESDGSNHRRALGVGTEGVIARGLGGESNGESLVHQGADRTAEGLVGGSNRDGLIPWGAARVAAEQTAGSGRELTGGPVRHFAAEQSQVRLSPTSDAPPGLPTQSELSVHPSPVDSGVIAVGEFRGSEQGTSPQRTLVTMERRPLGPDDLAFAVVPVFKDRGTQQAEPVQREAHPALTDAAVSGMRAVVTTCEVGTMTDPVVETMLRAVPITSSAHEREKSRSLPGRLSGKGGNTENVEKGTETELEETAERAAQTYLESADRSAGPGPGAEATETEVSLREAQVEKLHSEASLREAQLEKLQTEVSVREAQLEKAQKAVEEWERRCAAVEQERVKMVEAARQREVLLETRLELERRSRDEEGRRHDEQFAAAAATAQSTEAALQAALAAERVACQEARHALQAVTASHASAEARLRELDVSARADSGAGARLAAGAAVMSAVQQEVAVLKSVVGSERQEHRRLVGALRGALARAEEQAGREKEALGRELEAAREAGERERAEREGFMKELEEAREAGERGRAAVREGEQALAHASERLAALQGQCEAEAEAGARAQSAQQEMARQLAEAQRLLQEVQPRGPAGVQSTGQGNIAHEKQDGLPYPSTSQEPAAGAQHREAGQNDERQRQQWARLARAQRYSHLLQALRAKYKRRAIDAAQRVAQLEAALAEERARRAELEAAAGRERAHLAELEAGAGHERERLVEQHIQNLQDVEAKMLAAQARWQQVIVAARTDAEEKVAKAEAALTEARELWAAELAVECKEWEVKVEAGIVYARERQAERDACQVALQECTEQRDTWQREGQAAVAHLQAEYQRYRALKEREVQSLEARLQTLAHHAFPHSPPPQPRPLSPPTRDTKPLPPGKNSHRPPGAEISQCSDPGKWARQVADAAEAMRAVAENDGLRAMAGELQFARQEKCALEGKVAQLGERVEQLRAKLAAASAELVDVKRKAAREVGALQERLRAAQKVAATHSPEVWQQQADALAVCQAELKAARADAARKSRLLNSVESEAKQRAAAAAAAVDARAALEADLSKSKLAAARQAAVVKELHRKLEAAAGVDRDASGDQKRMQAAEEKVRSLSAALKSKEAALKEAKERAEVGASAAEREREKEMEKEREGLEAAVKKWQAEASRREAALRTCRNQLDTVRAERVAEAAAAEERYTAAQRQLEMAREELGAARAAEAELGTLAATLAKTGARAARALRTAGEVIEKHGAGAESEGSEEWREQGGETAAAAELVHLSMDEVRHLMGKGRKPSPGGGVLEGVLAEVDRCRQSGGGEKAKARRGGGRELTASLHKALAVLEQEVRWGEVMAAGA